MTLKVNYADGVDVIHGADFNTTNTQVNTNTTDIAANKLVTINPQTVSYTLVLTDAGKAVEVDSADPVTVTVPPNVEVAFTIGTTLQVVQAGLGQITVTPGVGVTIDTPTSLLTRAQWSTITLRKRATNTWLATGDTE